MTEPRLKKNKSGYWTLVSAERDSKNPTRWVTRSVSCKTKDRADAEAFRRAYTAMSTAVPEDRITVEHLAQRYLEHAEERGVGHGQIDSLKPVRAALGDYRPEDLSLDVQRAYRKGRKVSPGTLRRELGALIAVLNWAVKYLRFSAAKVPFVELPEMPPAREAFLDEAEEARAWALATAGTPLSLEGLFVCLALGTGARSGAIYALTWDRVDLVGETIDFRVPGERVTKKLKIKTVINARLLPVLRRARAEAGASARRVIPHGIRFRLRDFLTKNKFDGITVHAFRHTFVTLQLRAGVSLWDVAGLAGMSPTMVHKVYGTHVADARLRAEANRRFAA
jgi:integrase